MDIKEKLLEGGVIAVIRHANKDNIIPVVKALIAGGIIGIEITVENDGGFEAIAACRNAFDDIALGAGTVVSVESARRAIESGATFIFSPILSEEVVKYSKEQGVLSIPGCYSPTEIFHAVQWGADMVKIFPAANLGPSYIKNIRAPLPAIPMVVTGGIDLHNLGDFIRASADAVGIGSQLVDMKKVSSEGYLDLITENAKKFVAAVKEARGK
ncbi:MAG: 2-dehydro-3-deoxyphosphogluconate aldolase [Firmicutes bacterium HGW-Firmicutes-10]|nr:MAG: 2-dehydro-3-deoxyphosphogluconate aldolase [Firmicutes bacterium HGW-Firmicutes-19]PKM88173.1 MAG: 2-dehydro-3-deoxyphosphogluconate aldolase [Firmicutes bacterium HGW-Firmicutes-10]